MFNPLKRTQKEGIPRGHAHRNQWYNITLQTLAKKLSKGLKVGKQYHSIPFGHSLLDIKMGEEKTHIVRRTLTDEGWIQDEIYDRTGNFIYHLQVFTFEKVWEKTSHSASFTPELLKTLSIAIAEIVYDSDSSGDTYVFPFYNYFLVFEVEDIEEPTEDSDRYILGRAYIQEFNDPDGCGGSVGGTTVTGIHHRFIQGSHLSSLDHSIYSALRLNFKGDGQDWYVFEKEKHSTLHY